MTPQIIFNSSRKPLVTTKPRPAEPCEYKSCDCSPIGCLAMQEYRKQADVVIASAVPFKLAEDQEKITAFIFRQIILTRSESTGPASVWTVWEPPVNKPYDVPEGLEIEIRKEEVTQRCIDLNCGHAINREKYCCMKKEFAFLKQQSKEQIK